MARKYLRNYWVKGKIEAGCDEAGRGCLAGPVVAAAVILPKGFKLSLLNDSKKLSAAERETAAAQIREKAIAWSTAFVHHDEIDDINILNASFKAMHLAVDQLEVQPELLLIDGNRFNPHPTTPHVCHVKGDGRFKSIAAAGILAKTSRDAYMRDLHGDFSVYQWKVNKGYPTAQHRAAIAQYGPSPYHRLSFKLLKP